jgi:hypothetical protein
VSDESQGQVHLGQTGTLALRMSSAIRDDVDLVHAVREDVEKRILVLPRRADSTSDDVRRPQDRLSNARQVPDAEHSPFGSRYRTPMTVFTSR